MEKSVFTVGYQMEQAFPFEIFQKKGNTFRGIPLFLFSSELPENHCGVLLHVSVPNMRLDAFMGHTCSCSTSGEQIFINFNVFPCMKLISVSLANMPVLDARIYRFFTHYFAV